MYFFIFKFFVPQLHTTSFVVVELLFNLHGALPPSLAEVTLDHFKWTGLLQVSFEVLSLNLSLPTLMTCQRILLTNWPVFFGHLLVSSFVVAVLAGGGSGKGSKSPKSPKQPSSPLPKPKKSPGLRRKSSDSNDSPKSFIRFGLKRSSSNSRKKGLSSKEGIKGARSTGKPFFFPSSQKLIRKTKQ